MNETENKKKEDLPEDKQNVLGIKDILLTGVGLIALGAEKAKEAIEDIIKKGKESVDQNKDVLDNVLKNSNKVIDELKSGYEKILDSKIVRATEIDSINQKIRQLEERLELLENDKK